MKLGVLTVMFGDRPLADTLAYLKAQGVETVEIGCGGYPGKIQCDPAVLLADASAFAAFKRIIDDSGLSISALSCHGNPVHPDKSKAAAYHTDYENAVLLAEKLGLDTVITFSGCPGDSEGSKYPNWVTCPWPEDYLAILDYQWDQVLVPYWIGAAKFAADHGVRVALEMHPGFCVYNPETMLKLRQRAGQNIGANFDPSHLFWQGIDPAAAIRELRDCIYHFHAKDSRVDRYNTAKNGVLDTKHYTDEANRSWIFRAVGYGNGEEMWRSIMSELVLIGYEGAISIEHEDSLMAPEEGLEKAIALLKRVIIKEGKPKDIWWA